MNNMFMELNQNELCELNGGSRLTGWGLIGSTISAVGTAVALATTAPVTAGACIIGAAIALPVGLAMALGGDL